MIKYWRQHLSISAALLCATMSFAPAMAEACDLVVYGNPTLERALRSVGSLWQARTGTRVNVFVAPADLSYAQIERGARCDVIFAPAGAATDAAARDKIIDADTIERAFSNGLALVGAEPIVSPPANAGLADLERLIAGKTLAIANPDRDLASALAAGLLRKLGIAIDDGSKRVAVAESSAGVVTMLSNGRVQLGIVYATDARASGFKLAVPLATADQPPIEYVVARAREPASDTQPFMTFLKSAEARAAFKSAGLTPIDPGVSRRGRSRLAEDGASMR
jgi:molybdate transport system substrate-binding protein